MTDLLRVLPSFPVGDKYAKLIQALERNQVTTTELLTLDVADICKRTQLPLLDVQRLCDAVVAALHADLGVSSSPSQGLEATRNEKNEKTNAPLKRSLADLQRRASVISTLDADLDNALGGGVSAGYVTEITGESGAGKTQFLLSLLLAVQLPPPRGLGRPALYVSTEAALSTTRLSQMLSSHPALAGLAEEGDRPSLDNVMSTVTPDLESQEHILQFQVPVMVERRNVGLLVLDSVAANYRAEFERGTARDSRGSNMAARSNELVRLGALLRELAQKHNLAVVVANQVADRFSSPSAPLSTWTPASASSLPTSASARSLPSRGGGPQARPNAPFESESPLATRSNAPPPGALDGLEPPSSVADHFRSSMQEPPGLDDVGPPSLPSLALDHQQRWFTGWGDDPLADYGLKTPSLGLVWSTQIACRIALFKRPVYGVHRHVIGNRDDSDDDNSAERGLPTLRNWRRWMKVVFAPNVQPTGQGLAGAVEFEVTKGGLRVIGGGGGGGGGDRERGGQRQEVASSSQVE